MSEEQRITDAAVIEVELWRARRRARMCLRRGIAALLVVTAMSTWVTYVNPTVLGPVCLALCAVFIACMFASGLQMYGWTQWLRYEALLHADLAFLRGDGTNA